MTGFDDIEAAQDFKFVDVSPMKSYDSKEQEDESSNSAPASVLKSISSTNFHNSN